MASNGEEDDDGAIELQLEQQLAEHKESLSAVDEALASDSSNPELISVHEELIVAIKDAEEGLLHLKRSRLLREADTLFSRHGAKSVIENAKVEPLDPKRGEPEPLESETYYVGSKCRFRCTDGRWYNGQIVRLEDSNSARISFLNPTSESMLMCKFFLQQRCRFANNCRFSHGYVAPLSSLKQYIPTIWQQSLVGSHVWAASSSPIGIWQKAELESWEDEHRIGKVIFCHDGSTLKLKSDALALSEYAETSDNDEDNNSSTEASEYNDEEDGEDNEVGYQNSFMEGTELLRGVQTETAVFAKWENHTRGIASKMMARMGYREGMGLGVSGQGMLNPVSVKVLPSRQSLDHAIATNEKEESTGEQRKKRSRGGKRKREKKYAEAVRAAKAEEEQTSDVFSFINNQLAGQELAHSSGSKSRKESDGSGLSAKDRRSLVAYDDEIKDLRNKVEKLEEMVKRNRNDKAVCGAALRKLNETRKALADAETAHASAANAVVNKEKEKKWLKF